MESIKAIDDLYKGIIKKLTDNGQVKNISLQLMKLNGYSARVMFIYDLLDEYAVFPQFYNAQKSSERSEQHRNNGNVYFKESKDIYAYQCYNMALLYAPVESTSVALAYGNRSAALFRMKLFKESINDIQSAYQYNYPKDLAEKLEIRHKVCTKICSTQDKEKSTIVNDGYQKFLKKESENKCYVSATAKIEVRHTEEMGRHVIAKEDLDVGDVVAIEKPFVKFLLKSQYLIRCHYCFHTDYNLYPCNTCCFVMFCSKNCQMKAWKDYHSVECPIMILLLKMNFSKLELLALRTVIKGKSDYESWNKFMEIVRKEDSTTDVTKKGYTKVDGETDSNYVYDSKYYSSIHALATNIEKRSISDIFQKSVTAAVFLYLLDQHTSFFKEEGANRDDIKKLTAGLLLQHIMSCPTNMHSISLSIALKENEYLGNVEIGCGAYAFMSLVNHSCAPNVVRSNEVNGTQTLFVLRPIKKGMQLFDNYGYHHATHSKQDRQESLLFQYKFKCSCEACEDDWPLFFNLKKASKLSKHQQKLLGAAKIDEATIQLLSQGDMKAATSKYKDLSKAASALDEKSPCVELAEYQETIKQCLSLFHGAVPFQYSQLIEWY